MGNLRTLVAGLSALIMVGSGFQIIKNCICISIDSDDKKKYMAQIKNAIIALIISMLVAGGAMLSLIKYYYK